MKLDTELKMIDEIAFTTLDQVDAFIQELREINTNARSTLSMEWWVASALVYSWIFHGQTDLPIKIIKNQSDPPDFHIEVQGGRVGLEVVLAVSNEFEEAKSHYRKEGDGTYPINTNFMYQVPRSKKEWVHLTQKPDEGLKGPPVFGNFGRMHTAKCVNLAISKKIEKYSKLDVHFDLVVYIDTPSKIYCDELEDKNWVTDEARKLLEINNPFHAIHLLWNKYEVSRIDGFRS